MKEITDEVITIRVKLLTLSANNILDKYSENLLIDIYRSLNKIEKINNLLINKKL